MYFLSIMALDNTNFDARADLGALYSPGADFCVAVDESVSTPQKDRIIFGVNAAILGTPENFQKLFQVIPEPTSQYKWDEPGHIEPTLQAIEALSRAVKRGDLQLAFTFAAKSDFDPFMAYELSDKRGKFMIARALAQSLRGKEAQSVVYSIDGVFVSTYWEATRQAIKLQRSEWIRKVTVKFNSNPICRARMLTDNMAGAFAACMEEIVNSDFQPASPGSKKGQALLTKRIQIMDALKDLFADCLGVDRSALASEIDRRSIFDYEAAPLGLGPVSFFRFAPPNQVNLPIPLLEQFPIPVAA